MPSPAAPMTASQGSGRVTALSRAPIGWMTSAVVLMLACGRTPGEPEAPTMGCARRHDLAAWRAATAELRGPAGAVQTLRAVDIAASKDTTCAIDHAGALWCWGALGGHATPSPRKVGLDAPARALAGADEGFCAALVDGAVTCFGADLAPVRHELERPVNAVVMGDDVVLARLDDGHYVSISKRKWDAGEFPEDLADGDVVCLSKWHVERLAGGTCDSGRRRRALLGPSPRLCGDGRRWRDGCDEHVVERATTGFDGCELGADGSVRCVGRHARGLVEGAGALRASIFDPRVQVPLHGPASKLVGGDEHLCALDRSGQISCWGDNHWGQVGVAPIGVEIPPTRVPGLEGIVALAAGGAAFCALDREGVLWCWGAAPTIGRDRDSLCEPQVATPIAVGRFDDAVEIVVESEAACVRGRDGAVRCVGWFEGRRPRDDPTRFDRRRPVSDLSFDDELCLLRDDVVTCRLGPQRCMNKCSESTWLRGEAELVEIDGHCGRTSTHQVACWARWPLSVTASYAEPILQIRASERSWCVLLAGGEVSCVNNPDQRIGGHEFVDLSVHAPWACAVTRSGEVACWRLYDDDWAVIDPAAPELVAGVAGVTHVAVGERAVCGLLADQGVTCWGGDHDGELARGYLPYALDPLEVIVPADPEGGS